MLYHLMLSGKSHLTKILHLGSERVNPRGCHTSNLKLLSWETKLKIEPKEHL